MPRMLRETPQIRIHNNASNITCCYSRIIFRDNGRRICKRWKVLPAILVKQQSVSNECLNPIFDSNTIDNAVGVGNCGGMISQQDESGQASAPITSQTANPTIELQRATTTQPPDTGTPPQTCEECFDVLNDAQQRRSSNLYNWTLCPALHSSPG